jgi:uncharacterized protein
MNDWRDQVAGLTLKGQIAVPYTWWVGATGSRFLIALRDEQKILGNRCKDCGTVYVPPRKNCGRCFTEIHEWVELQSEGEVVSYSIVRFKFKLQPFDPPFAYALIRLDGADVDILHIIREKLDKLEKGARVRAKFKNERVGHMLDIECFELL